LGEWQLRQAIIDHSLAFDDRTDQAVDDDHTVTHLD
jgi:hypothetical protein